MKTSIKQCVLILLLVSTLCLAADKTFIDYFQPMPVEGKLTSDIWGAPGVLPRDPKNGLEDETLEQWTYWDGQIIKAADGKYHMFASRWDQTRGHRGWWGSLAMHAVADKVTGPYTDTGLTWPDNEGGKGHNVTALVMPDGRYAVVVSETRPGDVFVSHSLDGPWTHLGRIKVVDNEYSRLGRMSNVSIMARPDGGYMIVPRSGAIMISKYGILGPYTVRGPSIYSTIPEMKDKRTLEDPVIWHSGGLYHVVVNDWNPRKAYHITSIDGINNWTFRGLAYDPTTDFVRYEDGTVNHWYKLERPGVVIENGHVVAVSLSVLDVPKKEERGNDTHGSKIIVIPFDGEALDRDLQKAAELVSSRAPAGTPVPRPLYRDPPFDAPTDPVLCFNAESQTWMMYYTARRATATGTRGVEWIHGTSIGMAQSSDGGVTWTYKGIADIDYGKDRYPDSTTYWAPEVIWAKGQYHMFLSFVPGIFTDWNHPREIVHLTSRDGVTWDTIGPIDLKSDRVIDAAVIQLPNGTWRMWYKDERAKRTICYADSPDLMTWQPQGNAVTDYSGEGAKVINWKGRYWLIADCWRNGQRVWTSDDCLNWTAQDGLLIGSHGDAVISGGRAWWFYFGPGRRCAIDVVELDVIDGKLAAGDSDQPTLIDLKPERELEK